MGLTVKKFANTEDADSPLWIEQNHDDYNRRHNGLYIHSADAYGPQSIDDIPAMIETLQAIYDEFEANKPKGPKDVAEALADFPVGTVIKFDRDYNVEYINIAGSWTSNRYGLVADFIGWPVEEWPFTVKYNPNEEAN